MEAGLAESIAEVVRKHYATSSRPFLLSHLGSSLRQQQLWPDAQHPKRSLRDYIQRECSETLKIVRDPKSPARIAVADNDHLGQVTTSLAPQVLSDGIDISRFPRTVLLAFCTPAQSGQPIFIKKTAPYFFQAKAPELEQRDSFWQIDPEFRVSDLRLANPRKLSGDDRQRLQERISAWSLANGVPLSELQTHGKIPESSGISNALSRLIEAQRAEIRQQILIPADIALLLSEHE